MKRLTYCFLALLAPQALEASPQAKARAAFAFAPVACCCDPCGCGDLCTCDGGTCRCTVCQAAKDTPEAIAYRKESRVFPGTWDMLDVLNVQRRNAGLPPYIWDRELTMAAGRASQSRAESLLFGHTANDFGFLAQGVLADTAGCAAYPADHGFMACACYDAGSGHHAGAACTLGRDGKIYCHLFVRHAKPTAAAVPVAPAVADCPSGSWGTVIRSQSVSRWRRR